MRRATPSDDRRKRTSKEINTTKERLKKPHDPIHDGPVRVALERRGEADGPREARLLVVREEAVGLGGLGLPEAELVPAERRELARGPEAARGRARQQRGGARVRRGVVGDGRRALAGDVGAPGLGGELATPVARDELRSDGKPGYLRHIPRLWRYLERDLAHPELAGLKSWYDRHMPARTREALPA